MTALLDLSFGGGSGARPYRPIMCARSDDFGIASKVAYEILR